MSDDEEQIPHGGRGRRTRVPVAPTRPPQRPHLPRKLQVLPRGPRLHKARLFSILLGLAVLALVSTVFGMMMAVAGDLPQIENRAEYKQGAFNSFLYDDHWRKIGILDAPNHEVIDDYGQLGYMMRNAIISVEDKRFWSDPGVDIKGIARAFFADITGRSVQGASTIAQQFVKNALSQEDNRTIFEKLREAAMAYHLTRKWRRVKILTEYLNAIYFGTGAYGAESAARVYFGKKLGYNPSAPGTGGCGDPPLHSCASRLDPAQAALLAGMVANPSAFNPLVFPHAAWNRRDLVLQDMRSQHVITEEQYDKYRNEPLPTANDIEVPQEPPAAPYFTSWIRPQIILSLEHGGVSPSVATYRAYYGGLKIRTTIDLRMQQAAQQAIAQDLPSGPGSPSATLVTIDNKTGQVRAMVGGPLVNGQPDYEKYPFNLATLGDRQPGSAFKPFTLAVALEHGYGPSSVFYSKPLNIIVPHTKGREHFIVHNFGDVYAGSTTLAAATDDSDNSVYTQLGLSPGVGTHRVAAMARAMGIRTPVSTNYAMIIGGLQQGVTTLDLAHAYQTLADGGVRMWDPLLGAPDEGPTGIAQLECPHVRCDGRRNLTDRPHTRRVIPPAVDATIHQMLEGVVNHGTGTSAAIGGVLVAGKTGTTSNYGDAWFVGWTPQFTTAVWVGYPNKLIPMLHLYRGGPVEGGTFPADIWHTFMVSALQIQAQENLMYGPHPKAGASSSSSTGTGTVLSPGAGTTPAPSGGTSGAGTTPAPSGGTSGAGTTPAPSGGTSGAGTTPAPSSNTGTTPAPSGGGTGGGSGGGGTGGAGLGGGGGGSG